MLKQQDKHLRYGGHIYDPHDGPGMIVDLIPEGASVLDIGCGTGSISKIILEMKSAEITGIEPNFERAEEARKNGINVMNCDFKENLFTPHKLFDVVLFSDVLEHLVEPSAAISIALKYLKPHGLLITSIPNIAHWTVRVNLMLGRFDYADVGIMDATHLRWFTKKSILELFNANQMTIHSIRGTSGTWMPEYRFLAPWKWMKTHHRNKLIQIAAKKWPSLFGCQYVVAASAINSSQ